MDYGRLSGESYKEYGRRLYDNKAIYDLKNKEIGDILNREFPQESKDESAHRKHFVSYLEGFKDARITSYADAPLKPRLVVSDIHLPFAVNGWLDFIKEIHAKYNCHEEIIINGDMLDFHAMSFHTSETDAMTHIDEFEQSKVMVRELVKAFPNVVFTMGNHDLLLTRRLADIGIDKRFVKNFHELYELPQTWKLVDNIIIDDVYYTHIGCSGGKNGHLNSAVANMMSTCVGHMHSQAGVGYITNPQGKTIFGMNTGSLFDEQTYAGRYGKFAKQKSVLGCGVVFSSTEAQFIPFNK
jgi:hypothetical protein